MLAVEEERRERAGVCVSSAVARVGRIGGSVFVCLQRWRQGGVYCWN
jgi:hypothetical protein